MRMVRTKSRPNSDSGINVQDAAQLVLSFETDHIFMFRIAFSFNLFSALIVMITSALFVHLNLTTRLSDFNSGKMFVLQGFPLEALTRECVFYSLNESEDRKITNMNLVKHFRMKPDCFPIMGYVMDVKEPKVNLAAVLLNFAIFLFSAFIIVRIASVLRSVLNLRRR